MINIDGIKTAKSSIEFATSQEFLGVDLWPMQFKILGSLFGDVCMNRSCTDLEFWNGLLVDTPKERILERVTFLIYGKCPKCGKTRADFPQWYNFKNELILIAGMRSGKTALISEIIAPYLLHKALTRGSDNFGLMEGTNLVGTFFAPSIHEAINCDWHMFSHRIGKSFWFQEFHKALAEIEFKQEEMISLHRTPSSLAYPQHNISLYCGDYKNLAQIRGRTALFAVVSGHDSSCVDPSISLSEESLRSLRMTLRTIRSDQERRVRGGDFDAQQGMLLYQSSGFSGISKKLYEKATSKSSRNRSIGFRLATWEINPMFSEKLLLEESLSREDSLTFERNFAVDSV
jgi:hypothetical protein